MKIIIKIITKIRIKMKSTTDPTRTDPNRFEPNQTELVSRFGSVSGKKHTKKYIKLT